MVTLDALHEAWSTKHQRSAQNDGRLPEPEQNGYGSRLRSGPQFRPHFPAALHVRQLSMHTRRRYQATATGQSRPMGPP